MERQKRPKDKKVRVNISLDSSIYNEYGLYIDNLSGFINKTLKNYIEKQKELEEFKKHTNSSGEFAKDKLCYKSKKIFNPSKRIEDEPLNEQYKWWE